MMVCCIYPTIYLIGLASVICLLYVFQLVFRRRVQRHMEYRITRAPIGFEVRHKTRHAGLYIHTAVSVEGLQHLLPIEDLGFILIYFLLVVVQSPSGRGSRPYIRNHSFACFARFRISILRAFSLRVHCSSIAI